MPKNAVQWLNAGRLGTTDMNTSVASAVVAAVFTLALGSCDTPDRTDYRIAAERYERLAQVAQEGIEANEAAERSFAAQGDEEGARHAADSASQFRKAYEREQFRATKDRWLSEWWPSFR
jgi:hypothetical protein